VRPDTTAVGTGDSVLIDEGDVEWLAGQPFGGPEPAKPPLQGSRPSEGRCFGFCHWRWALACPPSIGDGPAKDEILSAYSGDTQFYRFECFRMGGQAALGVISAAMRALDKMTRLAARLNRTPRIVAATVAPPIVAAADQGTEKRRAASRKTADFDRSEGGRHQRGFRVPPVDHGALGSLLVGFQDRNDRKARLDHAHGGMKSNAPGGSVIVSIVAGAAVSIVA